MIRVGLSQRVERVGDERRDCLDQAWTRLLAEIGALAVPLPNLLPDPGAALDALELDGLILTGGNDLPGVPGATKLAPERDSFERAALEASRARGLPVLGVCRGLQHIVVHFGGSLRPIEGHVAVRHRVRRAPGAPPRALPGIDGREVNSFHDYGVAALPPALVAVALAEDGSVEALVHRDEPIAAILWHPERAPHDPRDRQLVAAHLAGGRSAQ